MTNQNPTKSYYLTKDGIEKLEAELNDLVKNERPKIAASLKEAKEFGDLSENASFDATKDNQAFMEGRISEIEHILKHTVVIESPKDKQSVGLGSTVHLELEGGVHKYTIVGSTEADPESGKISNESPIGQALLGRKIGEQVEIAIPSGTTNYKIVKIE